MYFQDLIDRHWGEPRPRCLSEAIDRAETVGQIAIVLLILRSCEQRGLIAPESYETLYQLVMKKKEQIRSPSFSNASIIAPKGKPHICKRLGYWRVSQWPKYSALAQNFVAAHLFIKRLNQEVKAK